MIKILTIIGARPQIIKAAAISRAISQHFQNDFTEVIVHTGQHYDENMSAIFFGELGIPQPNYNLSVGSGTHGVQTANMLQGIEAVLVKEKPNYLLIYGDTNSTLAGALAAVKLQVPVIHIEAGLRSFNKSMPEEINRILADHVSTYLFPPTSTGVENLQREGFEIQRLKKYSKDQPGIFNFGDIMYDNAIHFAEIAEQAIDLEQLYGLVSGQFILCTIHRNQNTDNSEKLTSIIEALVEISDSQKIFIPLHPRTLKAIQQNLPALLFEKFKSNENILLNPPVGFLEMIALEKNAQLVMTDSGGVQKEAFFFGKPCIIFREETEWTEIVTNGMATLTGSDRERITRAFAHYGQNSGDTTNGEEVVRSIYGKGNAAYEMLKIVKENHEVCH
jgi:UDP-GlcNAc3NAcA epimerase